MSTARDYIVYIVMSLFTIVMVTVSVSFVINSYQQDKFYEDEANKIYTQACLNKGGQLVDNTCVNPVLFEQAKIFIQLG